MQEIYHLLVLATEGVANAIVRQFRPQIDGVAMNGVAAWKALADKYQLAGLPGILALNKKTAVQVGRGG